MVVLDGRDEKESGGVRMAIEAVDKKLNRCQALQGASIIPSSQM
jgi:hypothetical protein